MLQDKEILGRELGAGGDAHGDRSGKAKLKLRGGNEWRYELVNSGGSLRVIRVSVQMMRIEVVTEDFAGNLRKEARYSSNTGKLMKTLWKKSGIKRSGMKNKTSSYPLALQL